MDYDRHARDRHITGNWGKDQLDPDRYDAGEGRDNGDGQLGTCWGCGGTGRGCNVCGGTGQVSTQYDPGPLPTSETRDTALSLARAIQMLHGVLALDDWRLASLVEDQDTPGTYLMLLAGEDRATASIHHEGDWRAFCARTEAASEE